MSRCGQVAAAPGLRPAEEPVPSPRPRCSGCTVPIRRSPRSSKARAPGTRVAASSPESRGDHERVLLDVEQRDGPVVFDVRRGRARRSHRRCRSIGLEQASEASRCRRWSPAEPCTRPAGASLPDGLLAGRRLLRGRLLRRGLLRGVLLRGRLLGRGLFRAGSGSSSACFFAAATLAFRASIRSTTLAVGSASTTSISSPLIFASTICSIASRYSSVNSSGSQSAVRFWISWRAISSSCRGSSPHVDAAEVRLADLVRPVHRLQHERVVVEAERREVLLVAEADLRDADLAGPG